MTLNKLEEKFIFIEQIWTSNNATYIKKQHQQLNNKKSIEDKANNSVNLLLPNLITINQYN